jgi:hypothetical protein
MYKICLIVRFCKYTANIVDLQVKLQSFFSIEVFAEKLWTFELGCFLRRKNWLFDQKNIYVLKNK